MLKFYLTDLTYK